MRVDQEDLDQVPRVTSTDQRPAARRRRVRTTSRRQQKTKRRKWV